MTIIFLFDHNIYSFYTIPVVLMKFVLVVVVKDNSLIAHDA